MLFKSSQAQSSTCI